MLQCATIILPPEATPLLQFRFFTVNSISRAVMQTYELRTALALLNIISQNLVQNYSFEYIYFFFFFVVGTFRL
jgi:hypothetical protein